MRLQRVGLTYFSLINPVRVPVSYSSRVGPRLNITPRKEITSPMKQNKNKPTALSACLFASVYVQIIHETLAASHGCLNRTTAVDKCRMTSDQWTCRSNCFPHCTLYERSVLKVHRSHWGFSQLWFKRLLTGRADICYFPSNSSTQRGSAARLLPDKWKQPNVFALCSSVFFRLPQAVLLSLRLSKYKRRVT